MSESIGRGPVPGESFVQPKIEGYRQLSGRDAEMMNVVKVLQRACEQQVGMAQTHIKCQRLEADDAEKLRLDLAEPERWVALARTHFQQGCMALTRAIAQPSL